MNSQTKIKLDCIIWALNETQFSLDPFVVLSV